MLHLHDRDLGKRRRKVVPVGKLAARPGPFQSKVAQIALLLVHKCKVAEKSRHKKLVSDRKWVALGVWGQRGLDHLPLVGDAVHCLDCVLTV